MRVLLCAVVGAAIMAAPAAAEHSPGGGGSHDFAAGAGKFATRVVGPGPAQAMQFSFSAQRTPSGEVHGFLNFKSVLFPEGGIGDPVETNAKGHVICIDVVGNRATIVAEFKGESPFGPLTNQALLVVEDRDADGMPDRAFAGGNAGPEGGPPPPGCSFTIEPLDPLEHGNVVVHDAMA